MDNQENFQKGQKYTKVEAKAYKTYGHAEHAAKAVAEKLGVQWAEEDLNEAFRVRIRRRASGRFDLVTMKRVAEK